MTLYIYSSSATNFSKSSRRTQTKSMDASRKTKTICLLVALLLLVASRRLVIKSNAATFSLSPRADDVDFATRGGKFAIDDVDSATRDGKSD